MIPIDSLLTPIRDDAPCGDDPSDSGLLFELETLIQGKPETQFSAAEEPDWAALNARALEVVDRTKDLRVAGILASAMLRTQGLDGFASGVKLIRGYVENFWESVHPLLDATENDDPSERLNALSNLAAPLGTDGDLLRIIVGLRKTHLLSGPRVGRFSLEHYLTVKGHLEWPENAGDAPSAALLDAAVQDAGPEAVAKTAGAAQQLLEDLAAIEGVFKSKAGPSLYPSFEPLRRELRHVVTWLGGSAKTDAGAAPAVEASIVEIGAAGGNARATEAGDSISGTVRNRADVLRALDAIIAYYQAQEPSSPVPYILGRVKRIVPMNFMELITELTPEAMDRIIALTGPVNQE
jgi:type VI secretion system protein ImpA